jgi:hypothetical protein
MPTFLYDEFFDADGTLLQDHAPDVGGLWTKLSFSADGVSYGGTDDAKILVSGSADLYDGGNASRVYRNAAVPSNPNYEVEIYHPFPLTDNADLLVAGRADATGLNNGQVDRYEIYGKRISSSLTRYKLNKWLSGVKTELGSYDASSAAHTVRLSMVGTAIKAYINGVERISVIDSSLTGSGRVLVAASSTGDGANGSRIDYITAADITVAKDPADDTSALSLGATEDATVLIQELKDPADDTAALSLEATEVATLLVLNLIDPADDTAALSLTGEAATITRAYSLAIKVGLLCDVEPQLVETFFRAGNWFLPGVPNVALPGGTIPTFSFDEGLNTYVLNASAIDDADYEAILRAHIGSLFMSPKDQRGVMRLYINSSLEANAPAAFRAAMRTPVGILPLTQDPNEHEGVSAGSYRRLNGGVFTWPPVLGGSSRYRAGQVSQRVHSSDLEDLNLLEIQAISTDATSLANVNISSIEILPVENGFFGILAVGASAESALAIGEILVMDGIDQPIGGYVVKNRQKPLSDQKNIEMGGAVPVVGSPLFLEPKRSNLITILGEWWGSGGDLGESREDLTFSAWIEIEPRYLFL